MALEDAPNLDGDGATSMDSLEDNFRAMDGLTMMVDEKAWSELQKPG